MPAFPPREQGAVADQAAEQCLRAGDSPGSQREAGRALCNGGGNHRLASLPPGQPAIVETTFFPLNSAEVCQETFRDEGAGCAAGQAEAEELTTRPCGAGRDWQRAGRLFALKAVGQGGFLPL